MINRPTTRNELPLFVKLQRNANDRDLAAYVKFCQLNAEYGQSLQVPKPDFAKIQTNWLKNRKQFVQDYPTSPDTAEALLQLGITEELAGQEDAATARYGQVVKRFPRVPAAKKAAGAITRLNSVGKRIALRGKSISGKVIDLEKYRGRVVLLHYWATWSEPCKTDMAVLKELATKYGSTDFSIVGISVDNTAAELTAYLATNRLPWEQIFEEGGLDSRPANKLGILMVPTMILLDKEGLLVNRNIQIVDLDREVRRLIQ